MSPSLDWATFRTTCVATPASLIGTICPFLFNPIFPLRIFSINFAPYSGCLYASNLFNLVEDTWDKEEGKYVLNMENDILPGCVITHDGAVVNETIKNILEGGA